MTTSLILKITDKLFSQDGYRIDGAIAQQLIDLRNDARMDLLTGADKIRRHFKGEDLFTCTITNAKSGRCSQDCAFCAQSAHHETKVATYPLMSRREMVDRALEMADTGVTHYSMVTSGFRLDDAEIDTICESAAEIKKRTGLSLCCSIGVVDRKSAEKLVQSGITNYHHNLETAESHFPRICTTHEYQNDIDSIRFAADAGLTVCSGGIFGIGETWEQRIELAMTLRNIGVRRVPVNFINPIPGTPLEKQPLLAPFDALTCIALMRYILPDADITICGGRDVTLRDFQSWVFFAGANGLMTGNYLTTTGRDIRTDLQMIADWKGASK